MESGIVTRFLVLEADNENDIGIT